MATKTFTNYVSETAHEYKYTLKLAVMEVTDCMMDCLETGLQKYQLKSASTFRKTPIQESPLDFPNAKNTHVFMCDIVMCYPASLDFLRTYVGNITGISTANIAVYSENDPRQIETDLFIERSSPEWAAKYKTALGNDYQETDKPAYGDSHNTNFLKELEAVRKARPQVTVNNPLSPAQTIDHSTLSPGYHGYNGAEMSKTDTLGFFGRNKKATIK